MTAKEYLMQYKSIAARISGIEADIEALRADRVSLSVNYDGMPRSRTPGDGVARAAIKLADIEAELISVKAEAWDIRREITRTIRKVENAECQEVLRERYIEGETWERIAEEMNYSVRQIHNIHGKALRAVEKIIA